MCIIRCKKKTISSPEFEPAGDEYGRAGQAYKVAKKYNDALVTN